MMYEIGKNIKRLRKQRNWTQEQLANKLYISRQTLSNYENGNRLPNLYMACQIADVFEISIDSLMGRKRNSPESGEYSGHYGGKGTNKW
ncbi:MAG: helix-turn-helix transcriptional regulator [Ruminococcus sp.]|nr:helix-turn-helix transcriptional regulator [Ruminococcus sp.]